MADILRVTSPVINKNIIQPDRAQKDPSVPFDMQEIRHITKNPSGSALPVSYTHLDVYKRQINGNLGLIMDVPLNVSVEIGKTRRRLKDVLNFNNGTVVELDKQADAPVDIIVNGQLIARGEVVVIDDNFGVRISEIVNTRSIIGNGE